jgi:small ligand-binding sensory domain FIST
VLGVGTELVGFYSNGEISTTSGQCDLHNQTMTLTLIGEV